MGEATQRKGAVLDPPPRVVLAVLALGLLVRIVAVGYWAPRLEGSLSGDPAEYLASGLELASTGHYHRNPEIDRMPGMAALIATGCRLGSFGCTWFSYLLFSSAGVFVAFVLWRMIVRQLAERFRLPSLAVLLFAVPELIFYSYRLLPDLPAMALAVGGAWIVSFDSAKNGGPSWHGVVTRAIAAGLLLGTALYLRPDYAVAGVAVSVAWAALLSKPLGAKRALLAAAVLIVVTALCVVPWGLRNQSVSGEFRVTSDRGVRAVWDGFNERRSLSWFRDGQEPWVIAPEEAKGGAVLRDAVNWIVAHPGEAAGLLSWRVVSHFGPAGQPIISASATQIPSRLVRIPFRLGLVFLNQLWLILGLLAVASNWRHLPEGLRLVGVLTLSRVLFPGGLYPEGGRFAMSLVPFLATTALWHWGSSRELRGRSWFAVWTTGVALALVQTALILRWGWI